MGQLSRNRIGFDKFLFRTLRAACLSLLAFMSTSAYSQTFDVLYTFHGGDGADPYTGLTRNSAGTLYGTTGHGGTYEGGTIFKLSTKGKFSSVSLDGSDGSQPRTDLVPDGKGNHYGATYFGGTCCGVIFKIDSTGKETVLYAFQGGSDGGYPTGPIVLDSSGDVFGTTRFGGLPGCTYTGFNGCGTIFKIDPSGNETVLYSFTGGADGGVPSGGLTRNTGGYLYGETTFGGNLQGPCQGIGCGTVFNVDKTGKYLDAPFYTFCETTMNCQDGANPGYGFVRDSAGNLYGVRNAGGAHNSAGTIFKLQGSRESVLHNFCSLTGCADGGIPMGGLAIDSSNNLYGTTWGGGPASVGVAFKLDTFNNLTVLHDFTGGPDGSYPQARLILDNEGNLYGTATFGGDDACGDGGGCGTVFRITP